MTAARKRSSADVAAPTAAGTTTAQTGATAAQFAWPKVPRFNTRAAASAAGDSGKAKKATRVPVEWAELSDEPLPTFTRAVQASRWDPLFEQALRTRRPIKTPPGRADAVASMYRNWLRKQGHSRICLRSMADYGDGAGRVWLVGTATLPFLQAGVVPTAAQAKGAADQHRQRPTAHGAAIDAAPGAAAEAAPALKARALPRRVIRHT